MFSAHIIPNRGLAIRIQLAVFFLSVFFVLPQCVQAKDIYVSPTGSDANAGTLAAPYKTFSKSVSVLVAGDNLLIMGGNYTEKLNITKSGTASAPITIKSANTQAPVVINLNNSSGPLISTAVTTSYVNILGDGIEVKNSNADCIDLNGQHNMLKNIVSHDCQNHGIYTDGQHNVIDGNTQYLSNLSNSPRAASSGWGSAIKLRVGADDILVQHNTVFHNYGEGVAATRSTNSVIRQNRIYDNYAVQIYVDNAINTLVENNFATCTGTSGFEYLSGKRPNGIAIGEEQYSGWGAQLSTVTIQNNIVGFCEHGLSKWQSNVNGGLKGSNLVAFNTFWGTTGSVISFEHDAGDQTLRISNNIANGSAAVISTYAGLTFDHNFWSTGSSRGTGDKVGDVKMATSPTYDAATYRLGSNSGAISAGAPITGIDIDYEGKNRTGINDSLVDIGAIEFSGSTGPIPTTPPANTPTRTPTLTPTRTPTMTPSIMPTRTPTVSASVFPSNTPSTAPTTCREDINSDGFVDLSDYSQLVLNFLHTPPSNPRADINQDGIVDLRDYSRLVSKFLTSCTVL